MEKTALVVGATGQVGRAAVRALVHDGWQVRAGARGARATHPWPAEWGVRPVVLDREDPDQLTAAVGDGCDVVVDGKKSAMSMIYDRCHIHALSP